MKTLVANIIFIPNDIAKDTINILAGMIEDRMADLFKGVQGCDFELSIKTELCIARRLIINTEVIYANNYNTDEVKKEIMDAVYEFPYGKNKVIVFSDL